MQFFKTTPKIDFMGNRNKAFYFSGTMIIISIISLFMHKGLNLSIDFVGGTILQLKFEKPIENDLALIRSIVSDVGFGQPEIKTIGTKDDHELQLSIERQKAGTIVGDKIKKALHEKYSGNSFELRREETVGPKVGKELGWNMLIAILLSLAVVLIYVGFRFNLPFGVGAVIPLFHDVFITIGVLSLMNAEITIPVVAALLSLVGYSLNDTIVIFDRIRENLGGLAGKKGFEEKINTSINETLSRTIITALTTVFSLVALFAFFVTNDETLTNFTVALFVGTIIGTYSTIFIASPILVLWNNKWPIK